MNAALEAFSYTVSPDLRTPLGTIAGSSDALLDSHAESLNEDGRHYISRIRRRAIAWKCSLKIFQPSRASHRRHSRWTQSISPRLRVRLSMIWPQANRHAASNLSCPNVYPCEAQDAFDLGTTKPARQCLEIHGEDARSNASNSTPAAPTARRTSTCETIARVSTW